MNEIRRLQYLHALGIEQWVANSPFVNAKATAFTSVVGLLNAQQDDVASLPEDKPGLTNKPKEAPSIDSAAKQSPTPHYQEKADSSENVASHTENWKNETVSYHLQLLGKKGAYACLFELPETGSLDKQSQRLIENIMKALEPLVASEAGSPMLPETFKWPMFSRSEGLAHIDLSAAAAKEALNAFLNSFIKRNRQKVLLVFGDKLHDLTEISHFNNGSILIIFAASLSDLQNNRALKKSLWEEIINKLG